MPSKDHAPQKCELVYALTDLIVNCVTKMYHQLINVYGNEIYE